MNRLASLLLLITFIFFADNNQSKRIIEKNKWIGILPTINYRIEI